MTRPHRRWTFAAACVLAVALILAAYANLFENAFHFDDSHVVTNNLYIRDIGNLPRFFRDAGTFSSVPFNATYRPLVTATLAVDYWIAGGLDPRQYHISQLTMLVLLAAMVFLLFRKLIDAAEPHRWSAYAALAGAALFAVHTTTTETMNLIHARSELMSVMGVVGSFLTYLYLPAARRSYLYLIPMAAGALAKNQAVMFGPLFGAYLFLFEQRLSLPDLFRSEARPRVAAVLRKALPALVVSVALLLWVESMNASTATYGGGSPMAYLRTQLWVWLHYLRLFVIPAGLTADTDWTLIANWHDTRVVAGLIAITLLLRTAWVSSKTQSLAPVTFGLSWFCLALLPASSVVPISEVANEHRVFFPYVGLSLAAVWGIAWRLNQWALARPRRAPLFARAGVTVALIAVFGNAVGTYERNKVWRTEETLWRDVTEKSPANGRGWMNYGLTQMTLGRHVEAKRLFERAAIYNPAYATLEVNLGIVNGSLGETAVAESHFRRALQLRPDDPSSYSYFARWLVEQGRVREAIPLLVKAVTLSPAVVGARHQLLDAYTRTGQTEEMRAVASETLAVAPGDAVAQAYLDGKAPPPQSAGDQGITVNTLLTLSLNRYQAGDFLGTIEAANQALALKPDSPEAFNNIAAAHASLQHWDEAIRAAREALRIKPDYPLARSNLAWAEAESRKSKQ